MKKALIGVILAILLPSLSFAAYDPIKMKADIDQTKKMFQIKSWDSTHNGTGWLGKSKIEGVVFTVNKIATLMMAAVRTKEQALSAITNCIKIGELGLMPKTKYEHKKINDAVLSATQKQSIEYSFYLNEVVFEAQSIPMGNADVLACSVKPAS